MKLLEFTEAVAFQGKTEAEKATLICYYYYKETEKASFSMSEICECFSDFGLSAPNVSRLKTNLIKGKTKKFVATKDKSLLMFIPMALEVLEQSYAFLWKDTETVLSNSELIDETKFCGKRNYLDRLISQINHSYANNCYDATAVLLRRLFEVLLILSYQNLGIDNEIKEQSGNGYLMLEKVVANAKSNQKLKLSRIKNHFDDFRMVVNFVATAKGGNDSITLTLICYHTRNTITMPNQLLKRMENYHETRT